MCLWSLSLRRHVSDYKPFHEDTLASLSLSTTLNKGQPRLRVKFLKNCIFCARRFPPLLLAGYSCLEAFSYKWPKGESALQGQVSGEKPRYCKGYKYHLEPGSTPCPSHPKRPLYHWASNLPILEGPWALSIIRYDDRDITMMMIVPSVMMVIQDDHGKRAELPKSIRKDSDPIWEDLISPCGALLYLDGLKRQHLLKSRHWGRTGDLEGDHSDRSFQVLQWQFHNPKAREAEAFLAVDKENITLTPTCKILLLLNMWLEFISYNHQSFDTVQSFQGSQGDSRHLEQSHRSIISRSEIIWDLDIPDISFSDLSCWHRAPHAHGFQPCHILGVDSWVNLICVNVKKGLLLTCSSIMIIIIIFGGLDTSLRGLLGSISKHCLLASNQSITDCLSCHWNMDPMSGLIAWL